MTIAEVAQVAYIESSIRLDDEARATPPTQPLSAKYRRTMAAVAYRAAKAEVDDPEPGPAPCAICGGVRTCDWDCHRRRP